MSAGRRSLKLKPAPIAASRDDDDNSVNSGTYHTRGQFHELPEWRRGSPLITSFYRMNVETLQDVVWSVFHFHNETLCIWTHICGVLLMLHLGHTALSTWLPDAPWIDVACFAEFWFGQTCQMLFSAVFHTCSCWTHRAHTFGARLDYAGIALTIGGSFIQPLMYAFWCRPLWAVLYNATTIAACVFATYVIWNPAYHTKEWQWLRAAVFVVAAVFGALLPMFHALFLTAPGWRFLHPMVVNLLEMGFFYLAGVAIYLYRAPERWFPTALGGIFSVFNSHSIWHIFVICAAVEHYNVEEENFKLFRPDGAPLSCEAFFNATRVPSPLFENKRWFELWL